MPKKHFLIATLFCLASTAQAQDPGDLEGLSLEELMDVKVSVTTQTEKPVRQAPGIVTVITEEQIRALGARDLREVLATVPGFAFVYDVEGNISAVMRGIWAQEGRVLLLVDGIEMNERSFGSLLLANHLSAELIKRVEIIRGPGSAIYGGFAELGVINVTTKGLDGMNGWEASSSYATTSKEFSQWANNFVLGHREGDLAFSAKGWYMDSNFSDRNYTDELGVTASLGGGNSAIENQFLEVQGKYKAFYLTYIKDQYRHENITLWGRLENEPGSGVRPPVTLEYPTDAYQVGYQADVTKHWNLHTYFQDKVQHPYFQPEVDRQEEYGNSFRRKIQRRLAGVRNQFHFSDDLNLQFGGEYHHDSSWVLNDLDYAGQPDTFGDGTREMSIRNSALFAQVDWATPFANLTAGLRYDDPSHYDQTLVPRLGLTKVFGNSHLKALYAQAFRAPLVENISLNPDIEPEITTTTEIEVGHQFNSSLSWTMNFFHTKVKDVIVYSYDAGTDTEHYNNLPYVATRGAEMVLRHKSTHHDVNFSYSFYEATSVGAPSLKTDLDDEALLGAPQHKVYVSDAIQIARDLVATPSLIYYGGLYGNEWNGDTIAGKKLEEQWIANIFVNRKNAFVKGLELGAGINNLLATQVHYPQPYTKPDDYRATTYPGQSREYLVRVGYTQGF